MKKIYRIGTVGLLADLPLYVARDQGYFLAEGLHVELIHELGWASIESNLDSGRLDAANVPTVMPLAISAGLGKTHRLHKVLAVTGHHSESLTLSSQCAIDFHERNNALDEPLRIGVESPYSFGNFFIDQWLKKTKRDASLQVALIPLSVSQLFDLLSDGYVQGVYGAEPLGFELERAELGITKARTSDLFPPQAQTVVTATSAWASQDPHLARALASAVERGRRFCANRDHHDEIFANHYSHLGAMRASVAPHLADLPQTLKFGPLISFGPDEAVTPADQRELLEPAMKACAALVGGAAHKTQIREAFPLVFDMLLKGKLG